MLAILSPAKSLDFKSKPETSLQSIPVFKKDANTLADLLKTYSEKDLAKLFNVNAKLAELNFHRFQAWRKRPNKDVLKQAAFAFRGDVYQGLQVDTFEDNKLEFAQNHVRILSGIYGVLKPLDLVQAYRLEMGTSLSNDNGKNLYQFWGDKITKQIKKDIKASGSNVLINLASKEYFKSVDFKKTKAKVYTFHFKEFQNGNYKFMSFFGKKARGLMAKYIIDHNITDPEQLKLFDYEGYMYNDQLSEGQEWVFTRDKR